MNMIRKPFFLTICVLFSCWNLAFAIPTYEDNTGENWWWNKDLELDFLDLTEVEDMHKDLLQVALTENGSLSDWRLATNEESTALYKSFAGEVQGFSPLNYDNAHLFFELFGVPQLYFSAWNDGNPTGKVEWNTIFDAEQKVGRVAINATSGYFELDSWGFNSNDIYDYSYKPWAALLVREHAVPISIPLLPEPGPTPVPEPQTFLLFGLGLAFVVIKLKIKIGTQNQSL